MKLNNWMKDIDPTKDLFALNIPGTHDCVTKYVQLSHISKTQDLTISEQLEIGVRALDIRVASKGERLKMVHGIAKAFNTPNKLGRQMDLEDVLLQCYSFLKQNPTETIIFQFKNDSNEENEKCFDNLFNTYLKGNENKWFLENRVPALGEVRGKIYLIRRCKMENRPEYTSKNTGLDFSRWVEQDTAVPEPLTLETKGEFGVEFIIQDRFKYKPEERWSECLKPFLDKATPFDGTYIINYTSTAGGFKGPKRNSQYLNPLVMKYPFNSKNYYGTVYFDFPTPELMMKIINLNFE